MENHTIVDPVCGMEVDPARAAGQRRVGDRVFHFCSPFCVNRFDVRPDRYAAGCDASVERACLKHLLAEHSGRPVD